MNLNTIIGKTPSSGILKYSPSLGVLRGSNNLSIYSIRPVTLIDRADYGVMSDTSAHFASANKEYLTVPSNASLQTGDIDFEIGTNVRLDTKTANQDLISKWGGSNCEYLLRYETSQDVFQFLVSGNGTTFDTVTTTVSPSLATWYQIRAWHDSVANTINIQINNGTITSYAHTTGAIAGTSSVVFGNRSTSVAAYLNGRQDSSYFKKSISTTAESTALYNAGSGRTYNDLTAANGLDTFKTGLTSWWDFNEEGGTRYDSKGTNHLTGAADPIIAPPVYGSELVSNPGFETAGGGGADVWANWSETAGDGAIADEGTLVHSGSHAAKITGGATVNSTYAFAQITVTAGASYYLSFWSRGDATNSGRYAIFDFNNLTYLVDKASTNNPTETYQLFTTQFTAPAGCTTIRIFTFAPAATGGIAYFDDFSTKQITTAAINNGGFDLHPATGGEKTNVATVSATRASNVATIVATAHGLKTADVVTIAGFGDTTLNGTNKAVTVVDVDTFTYASTGADINTNEILGNIGFETAGAGGADVFGTWSETAGDGTIVDETTLVKSGSHAAKLTGGVTPASYPILYQNGTVAPGASYSYSFWTRGDGTNAGRYFIYDVTNAATIISTVTGVSGTTYTQVSGTFTAPAGCTSVQVGIRAANATGAIAYFDDWTITRITAVTTGRIATDVFSSWVEAGAGSSTVNAETTAPNSGAYAARLDIDASNSNSYVSAALTATGKKYSYSFYAKASAGTPTLKAGGSSYNTHTMTTSYALYSGTYVADSVSLVLGRLSAASASIYLDQVTLTSLGPTAEAGIAAGNAIDGNFAAGFTGANYLSDDSNESLQTGDIDFELGGSFYIDNKSSSKTFITKWNTTGDQREYLLGYSMTSDRFQLLVSANGVVFTTLVANSFGAPTVGQYYFIRAWHNAATNTINIQVNNGTADSAAHSGGALVGSAAFQIGNGAYGYHIGRADGVYFRKAISTTDEATAIYNNGKGVKYAGLPATVSGDSALKGYWNLDEKAGTTRLDSTANDNDLADTGTVTQVQGVNYYEGTVGTVFDSSGNNNTFTQTTLSKRPTYCSICLNGKPAMLFDGVDDGLMASGDKIGTGDVTVTAVIKARGWGGNGAGRIVDWSGGTIQSIYLDASARVVLNNNSVVAIAPNSSIVLNTSYIVTVTRTSAGVVNIYINGALSGTADQDSGTPVAGSDTYIGNRAAGDRAFDGAIGEVYVFPSILTAAQRGSLDRYLSAKYQITLS